MFHRKKSPNLFCLNILGFARNFDRKSKYFAEKTKIPHHVFQCNFRYFSKIFRFLAKGSIWSKFQFSIKFSAFHHNFDLNFWQRFGFLTKQITKCSKHDIIFSTKISKLLFELFKIINWYFRFVSLWRIACIILTIFGIFDI